MKRGWVAMVSSLLLLGCGGDAEGDGGSGGAAGSAGTGGTSAGGGGESASGGGGDGGAGGQAGGGTGAKTDEEHCQQACEALIDCGVDFALSACTQGCLLPDNAAYLACIKDAPDDCNAAALCVFTAGCGQALTPSGTLTCQEAQDCGATCVGGGDPACGCKCNAQMDPNEAIHAYRLFVCWSSHCPVDCGPQGEITACAACIQTYCDSEDALCD